MPFIKFNRPQSWHAVVERQFVVTHVTNYDPRPIWQAEMLLEAGITHRLYTAGALELENRRQMIKGNESTVSLIIYMYDITSNHFSIHTKNWNETDILKHIASGSVSFDLLSPKYIQNLQYDTDSLTHKLKTSGSYFTYLLFWGTVLFLTNCALPVMGSWVTGLIL